MRPLMTTFIRFFARGLAPALICLISGGLSSCEDDLTSPQYQEYVGATPVDLSCRPNLDGQIDAEEIRLPLDTTASYLVSPVGEVRTVDLRGRDEGGMRVWDFSIDYASDQRVDLGAIDISGRWYASHFDQRSFAVAVDPASKLEAVYRYDATRLSLLGFASQVESPAEGQTLLIFEEALEYYRLPLKSGMSWESVGEILNGVYRGIPFAARYTYVFTVEEMGTLILPDVRFSQAHMIQQTLTINPLVGAVTTHRQASFMFECFGEVARVTSHLDEPKDQFTEAMEVRRLGLN